MVAQRIPGEAAVGHMRELGMRRQGATAVAIHTRFREVDLTMLAILVECMAGTFPEGAFGGNDLGSHPQNMHRTRRHNLFLRGYHSRSRWGAPSVLPEEWSSPWKLQSDGEGSDGCEQHMWNETTQHGALCGVTEQQSGMIRRCARHGLALWSWLRVTPLPIPPLPTSESGSLIVPRREPFYLALLWFLDNVRSVPNLERSAVRHFKTGLAADASLLARTRATPPARGFGCGRAGPRRARRSRVPMATCIMTSLYMDNKLIWTLICLTNPNN